MRRYLSPWRNELHIRRGCRRYILGSNPLHFLLVSESNGYWLDTLVNASQHYSSPEEAMVATDRWAAEQGYGFLTEEQWEKFLLLM